MISNKKKLKKIKKSKQQMVRNLYALIDYSQLPKVHSP